MTNPEALLSLAAKLEQADAAYKRVLAMSEGKAVTVGTMAIAAGMVLTLHGDLFAEAAASLRALSHGERG